MRIVASIVLALALLLAACSDDGGSGGSGDTDLAKTLGDVCTQSEDADTANIVVTSPDQDDEVSSPLVVAGEIAAIDQEFWVSAVQADGEHIIDYPGRSRDLEEGTLSPFEVSVPFFVSEATPACIWVYRENVPEPEDAIKIPVTMLPTASPEETPE